MEILDKKSNRMSRANAGVSERSEFPDLQRILDFLSLRNFYKITATSYNGERAFVELWNHYRLASNLYKLVTNYFLLFTSLIHL